MKKNYLLNKKFNQEIIKNKSTMKKINFLIQKALLLLTVLCISISAYAEGSKDLYPSGAQGGRAFLRASTETSLAYPYAVLGTHYVYAEVGERIALATSAQAFGNNNSTRNGNRNNIQLYGPYGNQITLDVGNNNDTRGRIDNRTAELDGPQLPNQTGGNRYTPIYHEVTVSGIYKVEYLGTSKSTTGDVRMDYVAANSNWTQGSNTNYLAAWDISVAKQVGANWQWENGRVYNNILNLDNPSYVSQSGKYVFRANSGFFGKFKVLTKDGFVYNIDNNGNQGISFTFMVNNKGFHLEGDPSTPSYKSINAPSAASVTNRYHNPTTEDNVHTTTHKIFYNLPSEDMPSTSIGAVSGGQTWLLNPEAIISIDADDIHIIGVDGTPNQIGNKGGYIIFDGGGGNAEYEFIISSDETPKAFVDRVISGITNPGENSIFFDGKDGDGNDLPAGQIPATVTIRIKGGEVHFPFIDMELNQNGLIIERLNSDWNSVASDAVYWNDSDFPWNNPTGMGTASNPKNANHSIYPGGHPSNSNGHVWGTGSNAAVGTFGDEKGMDTWTFIQGDATTKETYITVNIADLKISSLTNNLTNVCIGDEVTYSINVKNEGGPTDVYNAPFSFILPGGFEAVSYSFNGGGCGLESSILSSTTQNDSLIYSSALDLPIDCEATYQITVRLTSVLSAGQQEATATILRPFDYTDPDATNPDPLIPPTNPFFECENNGLGGNCNNILQNTEVILNKVQISIQNGTIVNADCNNPLGSVQLSLLGLADGTYTIYYDGGSFENVVVVNEEATLVDVVPGIYEKLTVTVNGCISEPHNLVLIIENECNIIANDDSYGPYDANGTTTPTVFGNDELNGNPPSPTEVDLTWGNITDEDNNTITSGFTLNSDGTITVEPGAPSGTYTITYTICDAIAPTNCDTATVTIVIEGCLAGSQPVIIECN